MQQLYLRQLDELQAKPLADTEGAVNPFFSPDGQSVAFWSGGEIKKVPVRGGPAVTICKAPLVIGATWAEGDNIFFGASEGLGVGSLWRVSAAGGGLPERVATPDASKGEYSYRLPHALPGGKALLFTVTRGAVQWDSAQIVVRFLETGKQSVLTEGMDARYSSTGHLLFVRGGTVLAAPFDLNQMKLTGDPVGLLDDVMQSAKAGTVTLGAGAAQSSVSSSGSLAYATGGIFPDDLRSLMWVDRTGAITMTTLPPRVYWAPRLAPDGQRLAFYTGESTGSLVWVHDFCNRTTAPLTELGSTAPFAVWTPDGSRVTFRDSTGLFWRPADGSGRAERLTTSQYAQYPNSWSPEGKTLAFVETRLESGNDIWLLGLENGKPSTRPFVTINSGQARADWSPNGRWLAYESNESGRTEVYVQPYPGPGPRYPVSRDGGNSPMWARDGRELFYVGQGTERQAAIMVMPVTATSSFSAGPPRKLFEGQFQFSNLSRGYDVTPDGRRFVMVQPRERAPLPATEIVVVENWFEELKQKVPPTR